MNNRNKTLHSLPLITYNNKSGYHLQEQAIKYLKSLPIYDKYSIITIAGKHKTGKSYFINQILEDQQMFPVSSHIDDDFISGNKKAAIMISTKLLQCSHSKGIVLDVAGFGSIQGTDDRDCKLFMLAILLSSVVIYNSVGTIDQQSLNNLSMVIQVGKIMEKELVKPNMFPALLWVLRDFSLKMEDKKGNIISSKQYLENALDEQKGESQTTYHKNRIRRIIKALFTQRNCETVVIPAQQSLLSGEQNKFRPQFLEDLNRIKGKLIKTVQKKGPKQFCGIQMTGNSFITAISVYIQALNRSVTDGSLPQIENMTFQLRKTQAKGLVEKFNQFLGLRKQQMIFQLSSKKKQKQNNQFNQYYLKAIEPIQKLYESTRKNIYELTGQMQQSQLQKIKQLFYETIEKQIQPLNEDCEDCQEQQLQLANICEYFCHITEENQLQKQYFHEIKELRNKYFQKNNIQFANILMKIQIAYLRRKIQLGKQRNLQVDRLSIELQYSKKQVQKLTERNKQLQNQILCQARQSRTQTPIQNYNTPNKNLTVPQQKYEAKSIIKNHSSQNYYKDLVPVFRDYTSDTKQYLKQNSNQKVQKDSTNVKNTDTFSNMQANSNTHTNFGSKIESVSFYVPYVMIEKSEYLNVKIIRTLIKQDSRRNSYIEYVIEINLLDQKWVLNRKFKDFSELHSILVMMYQYDKLPSCKAITGCVQLLQQNPQIRKQIVEARRKQLEYYLTELICNENIRNSRILQKFLKINKQYTVL